jgi:simple sugar transport system substrate-binding protein
MQAMRTARQRGYPPLSRWAIGGGVALVLSTGACRGSPPSLDQEKPPRAAPVGSASAAAAKPLGYSVGVVLVGVHNDKGWNQAHLEGIKDAVAKMPDVKIEYVDKVNPADRPNVKASQVADDLISRGARFIAFTADDYKDDALETARKYPDVTVIHISGDYAWREGRNFKDQKNLGNIWGRVEDAKLVAGCAAALSTGTGKIGYLGPLLNDETRRLVSAAYLGARHCFEKYRKKKPEQLAFKVTWIGFWAHIPGVTLDPGKVVDDFYESRFDVVMSGLDTSEGSTQLLPLAPQTFIGRRRDRGR